LSIPENAALDASHTPQIAIIEKLYTSLESNPTEEKVLVWLRTQELRPEDLTINHKKTKEICTKIKDMIVARSEQRERYTSPENTSRVYQELSLNHRRRQRTLEAKNNKSQEEVQELQVLQYYADNPEAEYEVIDGIVEGMAGQMKYLGLDQAIRSLTGPWLANEA
jgi:hypothetical protein